MPETPDDPLITLWKHLHDVEDLLGTALTVLNTLQFSFHALEDLLVEQHVVDPLRLAALRSQAIQRARERMGSQAPAIDDPLLAALAKYEGRKQ